MGRWFEDFTVGQEFRHPTPRTMTEADAALNVALYGSRFALQSSDTFAQTVGLPRAPLDDLLVFHTVFGKTFGGTSTVPPGKAPDPRSVIPSLRICTLW